MLSGILPIDIFRLLIRKFENDLFFFVLESEFQT